MASCCRRYRARRLKALGHDPQLLVIRPAPPATSLDHLKPFKLSTALMAVHKDCYAPIGLIQQGGPRRRETIVLTWAFIENGRWVHLLAELRPQRLCLERGWNPFPVMRVGLTGPRQLLVYPDERTFSGQAGMSQRCQEVTCEMKEAANGGGRPAV